MCVAVIICGAVALVLVALCVPLELRLRIDVHERAISSIRLAWLFGLVRKRIERPNLVRVIAMLGALRIKGLPGQVGKLTEDVRRHLRGKELQANFRVGLDDPADTALFFGPIGTAAMFLNLFSSHDISIRPSFDGQAVMEGCFQGAVRLLPIQLLPAVTRFALSRAVLRMVRSKVRDLWKRKK